MSKDTIEKTSKKILLALALANILLFIGFGIHAITKETLATVWYSVLSITLGTIILVEAGVTHYFNSSTYRSLNGKDILGLVSILVAGASIMNGVLALPYLGVMVPTFVATFFGSVSIVVGIVAGIVAIVHMLV